MNKFKKHIANYIAELNSVSEVVVLCIINMTSGISVEYNAIDKLNLNIPIKYVDVIQYLLDILSLDTNKPIDKLPTNKYEGKIIRFISMSNRDNRNPAATLNTSIKIGGAKLIEIAENANLAIMEVPEDYDEVMTAHYADMKAKAEAKYKDPPSPICML
jgi:hypothetical protein